MHLFGLGLVFPAALADATTAISSNPETLLKES